jgi:hypothetical protein
MAASLLSALALPVPGRKSPGPGMKGGPTGPIRAPGVTPKDEIPGARTPAKTKPPTSTAPPSNEPSDAEIERAKAAFNANPLLGAALLAAAAARLADKARRDPIVQTLRDGLAKLQPFTSTKAAKDALNKALDELAEKALSKGFLKLLETALGKKAGEVKRPDTTVPPGGPKPDEAPGEVIVTKDFPIGKAGEATRFAFEGLALNVRAGQSLGFTVHTPSRWKANDRRWQGSAVVLGRKADQTGGTALSSDPIKKKGANRVVLKAPDAAGMCLIYVVAGAGPESQPVHEIEVLA